MGESMAFATGSGKVHHAEFAMAFGEMTTDEFTEFLSKAFTNLKIVSVGGSLHYVCMDWRHQKKILAAAESNYSRA
jgi:hypothetical protein